MTSVSVAVLFYISFYSAHFQSGCHFISMIDELKMTLLVIINLIAISIQMYDKSNSVAIVVSVFVDISRLLSRTIGIGVI